MEQVALRLEGGDAWTWLGGEDDGRRPRSVVLRAFDADVVFTAGDARDAPDAGRAVTVPRGEGRRLEGRHFFARAAVPCRASVRGI